MVTTSKNLPLKPDLKLTLFCAHTGLKVIAGIYRQTVSPFFIFLTCTIQIQSTKQNTIQYKTSLKILYFYNTNTKHFWRFVKIQYNTKASLMFCNFTNTIENTV